LAACCLRLTLQYNGAVISSLIAGKQEPLSRALTKLLAKRHPAIVVPFSIDELYHWVVVILEVLANRKIILGWEHESMHSVKSRSLDGARCLLESVVDATHG